MKAVLCGGRGGGLKLLLCITVLGTGERVRLETVSYYSPANSAGDGTVMLSVARYIRESSNITVLQIHRHM